MPTKTRRHAVGETYLNFIQEFPLRPLLNDPDLDVLSRLVEDFEDAHDPLPDLKGVDVLRFLIEENGLFQTQLSEETGDPTTTLSELLTGKRGISPKVRAVLSARFKVDPTLFV